MFYYVYKVLKCFYKKFESINVGVYLLYKKLSIFN